MNNLIIIIIFLMLLNIIKFNNTEYFSQNERNVWFYGDSLIDHSKFNNVKNYNIENLLSKYIKYPGKAIAGLTADTLLKAINNNNLLLEFDDTDKYIKRTLIQNNLIDVSNKLIKKNDIVFLSIGSNDFIELIKENNLDVYNIQTFLKVKNIISKIMQIISYYLKKLKNPNQLFYIIPYRHFIDEKTYNILTSILESKLSKLNISFISLKNFNPEIDYLVDKNFDDDTPHFTKSGVTKIVKIITEKLNKFN